MYPFNKKQIAALENQVDQLTATIKSKEAAHIAQEISLRNQIEYLIHTVRKMDDMIFSMGQCPNWESMRPRFQQLHDEMTARKVAESNRIGSK